MKVEEIKKLLPKCDVYALAPNVTHIIVYDQDRVSSAAVVSMARDLMPKGIYALLIGAIGDDPIHMYAIKETDDADRT